MSHSRLAAAFAVLALVPFSFVATGAAPGAPLPRVPLTLWTTPTHPEGVAFGLALGVSCGDWDRDGWVDFYVNASGELWRNLRGKDWSLVRNLNGGVVRNAYGAAFGDWDADGLPDLATEPRPGNCFRLFHNRGGGQLVDVAGDPRVIPVLPCREATETACWGDVDGDGWLDLFLPSYPPSAGGTQGNWFWRNRGPVLPGGEHAFEEQSVAAGLAVPAGHNRPEGAQLCDYDGDGDLDLYSNGALYQNVSVPGSPKFRALSAEIGIGFSSLLDEGAAFCDYDLDGDFDLLVTYASAPGVVVWESRGDGTFERADVVQDPRVGMDLGISIADWDHDGDPDMTSRFVFRGNVLMETGARGFDFVRHTIPGNHIDSPSIAWGDLDRDGDLDAVIGNLGVFGSPVGHLYRNTTYDGLAPSEKRHLRISPLQQAAAAAPQTELGATATVSADGQPLVLSQFTATSHGYLNQNEYALHFTLPERWGLSPTHTRVDVAVRFPGDPSQPTAWVDRGVQPLLGDLAPMTLTDRELLVDREGDLRLDGCDVSPSPRETARVWTTGDGLLLPDPGATLPPLQPLADGTWAGLALRTNDDHVRVVEVTVDGVVAEEQPFQMALWDVTASPRLVAVERFEARPRNHRSSLPVDLLLRPGREYRLVLPVVSARANPFPGPETRGELTTLGGVVFSMQDPENGHEVESAEVDASSIRVAIRHRPALAGVGIDLGGGFSPLGARAGALALQGEANPSGRFELVLSQASEHAPVVFVASDHARCVPTGSGRSLIAGMPQLLASGTTSGSGELRIGVRWPRGARAGERLFVQALHLAPSGAVAASNVLFVSAP